MKRWKFAAATALFATTPLLAVTYTVTTTADSGAGTLRQAILDANANAGADTIQFNIVGSGVHTIAPVTKLPNITEAVTINGYSQPGASANTSAPNQGSNAVILIELNGQNLAGFDGQGLDITSTGVTIRGLAINRCQNSAIRAGSPSNGMVIAGNFLGTDPSGSSRPGAQNHGVELNGVSGPVIGGGNPADRNVIAGNDAADILLDAFGGSNAVIQGNLIGLNAAGTAAVEGQFPERGIYVRIGTGMTIGGTTPALRNVIAGRRNGAIVLGYTVGSTAAQATIQGNYIGTDVTGTQPIPNSSALVLNSVNNVVGGSAAGAGNVIASSVNYAITGEGGSNEVIQGNFIGTDASATLDLGNQDGGIIIGGSNWTIGGEGVGEGNVIAHNGAPYGGIAHGAGTGTRIRANRIFDNETLGIDLYAGFSPGVTPNDAGDGDAGPNNLQNYPILTSAGPALADGTGTHIVGVLNSTASTTFDIDFFSNPPCAPFPQEYLEGQDYLGSTEVTTDGSGNAAIDITLPVTVEPGARITATATDPSGNTSEFSQRLIFSMSPAAGPPAGGTSFTITGMLFADGATVTVGGQPATNIDVVNPTQITATSPALPAGSLNNVVVTNTDQTGGTLVNGWVADFSDVPGSQQFYFHITKLVANAITVGCGTGIYCPLNSVTRQQMAVFLLKSKNGLCYVPPPCTGVFPDVPCSSGFAPWIEALAAAGITGGCGGGNYCPANVVTRQQMAVFLLKTKHGSSYVPPACSGDFLDVPCPSQFADWIEQLAAESITGGCGGGNYCPTQAVRRDQMAAFLYNTFQFP
jgi:hypothetical protein